MAVANPNRVIISDPIWNLWTGFDAHEPTAVLAGIFAPKPGYHNFRSALSSRDYSVADVAADRMGPSAMAAAIDITMSSAAMKKYTARLDRAARARDPRLYPPGQPPVLREFIGTLNGTAVYCYMLTGGIPQGVGSDAGPDWDRDSTHLWHLHLSIIRQHINDRAAMEGLLSVLKGEPLPEPGGEVKWTDPVAYVTDKAVKYAQKSSPLSGFLSSLHYYTVLGKDEAVNAKNAVAGVAARVEEVISLLRAPRPLSDSDVARVADAVAARIGINPGETRG